MPLDDRDRIDRVIAQAKQEGKLLLAYDAAGHQIRWFQYYLKEKGVTNLPPDAGRRAGLLREQVRTKPDTKVVVAPPPAPAAKGSFIRVNSPAPAK